jgi:hypothetical protein
MPSIVPEQNDSPSDHSVSPARDDGADSYHEKGAPIVLPNGRTVSPVDEKRRTSSSAAVATILQHSNDADEAMKVFLDGGEVPELTPETNARLLKIIDWHLMPLMCLIYGLNYLDKVGYAFSRFNGVCFTDVV